MTAPLLLKKGFTLVEVLVVITVISVLASAGYYTASSVQQTVRENKLESDVVALNSAVQIYEATGGDLSDDSLSGVPGDTPEEKVLTKLKIKGDVNTQNKYNGVSGSLIDARMSTGDTVSSGSRAVWNSSKKIFEVKTSGDPGVKEFVLSDEAATEARAAAGGSAYVRDGRVIDAADIKQGKKWVWEYTVANAVDQPAAGNPGTSGGGGVTEPSGDAAAPEPAGSVSPTPTATATASPTPTATATASPSPSATPETGWNSGTIGGLIVNRLEALNGILYGSVQMLSGNSFTFNGSTELYGDLYLPGTPTLTGNKLSQMVTNVVDLGGSPNPSGYEVRFDGGKFGENGNGTGTVYIRVNPPTFETLDQAYVNAIKNNSTAGLPVIPVGTQDITINGGSKYPLTGYLPGGNYKAVTVSGELVLGTPGQTTTYNFESLTVNGSGKITINGPIVINLKNGGSLNNLLGLAGHPDWLTVYSQGNLTVNGGAGIVANKIVTNKELTLNNTIDVETGIIAYSARVNGGGVITIE